MMPFKNITTRSPSPCSIPSLFISLSILTILPLSLFFFHSSSIPNPQIKNLQTSSNSIKVYIPDLPRSLNYGLLEKYWSLNQDSRIGSEVDNEIRKTHVLKSSRKFLPYPENPIIKQYSAEYWILGDLVTPESLKIGSFAKRVFSVEEADVIFVPFFATLSAEMQLIVNKGVFRKKEGNGDYERQRMVVDFLKKTEAWKRSGGRDHVFVITDPVAMWHVKAEVAPAVLLVVDFGGWYKLDSKASNDSSSSDTIHHTQVSLLKDVIVPYTHLLPRLPLSENQKRETLLYFKGAKHRHRGGIVREKLWDLLINEPRIVMEEGFPNATGKEQSIKGMRTSEFCLHPAGDTPTSCRLFDAIQSLCIPVIVSDNIELPFEGMVDYSEFSVFVAVSDALQPSWLVNHLRSYSDEQKDTFRRNMARVQPIFEYENGQPGGIGPISPDGAINYIWKKVHQKLPMIKEAIIREKRKPPGVSVPLRCHCS
ncbi:probable arabinosyltransferase ARAD2 [Lycium barbarum]|uniref:probable arabinosyltransferase ARAD2 n=1 Tax=Lycium barbarum TaxID=112863 RepID=UPI00293E5F7B|nr:probable arabinosyltransferase ARAD2 [Lycium barbarum]